MTAKDMVTWQRQEHMNRLNQKMIDHWLANDYYALLARARFADVPKVYINGIMSAKRGKKYAMRKAFEGLIERYESLT